MMLLAGIGNGLGDFFSKIAATKMSPYWSAIIMSLAAVLTVGVYYLFVRSQPGNMLITKSGVFYSVLGGVCIGLGMVFFFGLFSRGANLSVVNPVAKSLVVFCAVVLGALALKEKFSWLQALGAAFSILGIYFLTK